MYSHQFVIQSYTTFAAARLSCKYFATMRASISAAVKRQAEQQAIPEFAHFNIMELKVRNGI